MLKPGRIYILAIVAFLAILFVIEMSLPKKFVWKATFSRYDHQPFGSAVFDDMMVASINDLNPADTFPAYSVTSKTLYQLSQDSTQNYSILVIADRLSLGEADRDALFSMLERGSKIMLVASNFNYALADTLGFESSYGYFSFRRLKSYVTTSQERDTIHWEPDSIYRDNRMFYFYPHLSEGYLYRADSVFTTLASQKHNLYNDSLKQTEYRLAPCAIKRDYGKGQLIISSTPLLFTNYGMLDGENSAYLFRVLGQLRGMPIIRTEAYGDYLKEYEETPFRYFLSLPPLRWALYMTLITIVLFMIFTARREQRAIPIIRKPANKTVEFVRLIGTLYFQRKDHTDLVQKKFIYLAETLRRTIQVDIEDDENDSELARRISQKTGVSETGIYRLLTNIRPVLRGGSVVDEVNMRNFIEDMNEIINHI